ncbi:MAG: aromatic-ring-hydroxylating dioxygenase beta subunit [Pseudonocardiales bacterium]|nr:aromatic-ring-hydroxylating dioxygenase beta subunit [Pseudonocardiales bacterium]
MTAEPDHQTLPDLIDRDAIRQVLARYCRAVDRCDEQLLRSCYHSDALDRHGRFEGTAQDFASWVIDVQRTASIITQHAVSNVVIELDRDTAWVESAFVATHVRPPAGNFPEPFIDTFWGRYVDRFERRAGTWAIASREVVHDWSERRASGPRMAHVDSYRAGRRDCDDPSYERAAS